MLAAVSTQGWHSNLCRLSFIVFPLLKEVTMLEFIQNNETLSQVLIVVSLLLNALIGLKPVIGYIVKKTKESSNHRDCQ